MTSARTPIGRRSASSDGLRRTRYSPPTALSPTTATAATTAGLPAGTCVAAAASAMAPPSATARHTGYSLARSRGPAARRLIGDSCTTATVPSPDVGERSERGASESMEALSPWALIHSPLSPSADDRGHTNGTAQHRRAPQRQPSLLTNGAPTLNRRSTHYVMPAHNLFH